MVYFVLECIFFNLFGVCMVGINGKVYLVGDVDYEFIIMSVFKFFVFVLVCQVIGVKVVCEKLGVNSMGMVFNLVIVIEWVFDGCINFMVNFGVIVMISLVFGVISDE